MEQTPYPASPHSVRPDFCSSFLGGTVGSFVTTETAIHRVTCMGYWLPNHPAIVLFLVLGVQGTSSLLRQFIYLLSVTGFRHLFSHRRIKTRQLFSLTPVTTNNPGNPPAGPASQDLLRWSRLYQSLSYLDHRARTGMSSSLRRNKGKSGSEQVNHVSYC